MKSLSEKLEIKQRVTHIKIKDMEAPWGEVNGKTVRVCLNGCGKPVPAGNRKYCSVECANQFWAKHSQKGLREYVFKRDKGTCRVCGWKNLKFTLPYPRRPGWVPGGVKAHRQAMADYERACEEWDKAYAEWLKKTPRAREFVADHIIPIALGGAEFDLNNVQLLCDECNKRKTAQDAAKIAKRRKLIRYIGSGGEQLSSFSGEVS